MDTQKKLAADLLSKKKSMDMESFVGETYSLTNDTNLVDPRTSIQRKSSLATVLLIEILSANSTTPPIPKRTQKSEKTLEPVSTSSDLAINTNTPKRTEDTDQSQPKPELIDHYSTIGVPSTASQAEIDSAYRKLAKEYHPDTLIGKGLTQEEISAANTRMQDINIAYGIVGKPTNRSIYDNLRSTKNSSKDSGGIAKEGLKQLGKSVQGKVLKQTGLKIALKQIVDKIIVALGGIFGGGPIGAAIGKLVAYLASKLTEYIGPALKKSAENIAAAGVVVTGFGLVAASTPVVVGGVGLATTGVVLGGGIRTLSGGFRRLTNRVSSAFRNALLPGIVGPLIGAMLGLPLLVVIILLIINNSAYVTPPGNLSSGGVVESQYIGIEKIPNPEKLENITSGTQTITYSIRIYAKKGALTNISISNDYRTVGNPPPPTPAPTVPEIDTPPDTISPSQDYVFTYEIPIDSSYNDSIVIDTLTVTADAPGSPGDTAAVSASVVIGTPPLDCPLPTYNTLGKKWASYTPGDESKGHGSGVYWGTQACQWRLPQSLDGCYGPNDPAASQNPCYNNSQGTCSDYGKAYDVFPAGSTQVFAPQVVGQSLTWTCSYGFSNGGGSAGYTYICSSGEYKLVLTHMEKGAKEGTVNSGELIGVLHSMGNTHLHLEFAIGGQYQRPEDFFCF